ncbi:MAG: hypothetical protein ACFFD4_10390 [Candidatus Odinarchaeota archaeon]
MYSGIYATTLSSILEAIGTSDTENIFIHPKKLPSFRSPGQAMMKPRKVTDQAEQAMMKPRKVTDQAENRVVRYNDLTGLIMIKVTGMGPVVHDYDIPFIQSAEKELSGLATYYNIALGQGRYYNQGLFGPLPVLATDYRSLVYAVMVNDSEQTDERFNGQNYVLLCFLYHEKLDQAVYKCRDEIEDIFVHYFSCNKELSQVEQDLENIKVLIQDHLY